MFQASNGVVEALFIDQTPFNHWIATNFGSWHWIIPDTV